MTAETIRFVLVEILRVEGAFARASSHAQLTRNAVLTGILIILATTGQHALTGALTANVVASLAATVLAAVSVRHLGLLAWSTTASFVASLGRVYRLGLPFFLSGFASVVLLQGDVVVARVFGGSDTASAYAIGFRLSLIVVLPFFALTALVPRMAVPALSGGDRMRFEQEVQRLTFFCSCVGAFALACIIVAGARLVVLISGTPSDDAYWAAVILGVGLLTNVITGPSGEILSVAGLSGTLLACNFIGIAVIAMTMVVQAQVGPVTAISLATAFTAGAIVQNVLLARSTFRRSGILPLGLPARRMADVT